MEELTEETEGRVREEGEQQKWWEGGNVALFDNLDYRKKKTLPLGT